MTENYKWDEPTSILDKVEALKVYGINCEVGATNEAKTGLFEGASYLPSLIHITVDKAKDKNDLVLVFKKQIYGSIAGVTELITVVRSYKVLEVLGNEDVISMVDIAYNKMIEAKQEELEMKFDFSNGIWKAKYLPKEVNASGRMFDREEAHKFGIRTWSEGKLDTEKLEVSYLGKVLTYADIPKSIDIIVEMMYRLECKKNKNGDSRSIYGE